MLDNAVTVAIRKLVRGFLLLPIALAVAGMLLAGLAVWLDRTAPVQEFISEFSFFNINEAGARAVLSTIAGAMMTVISLVYSLTLIVFTLAASNIGPRVLETFTDNRINQTTVGFLGATFLYSLFVLYVAGDDEVPKLSVAIAIVMVTVSFFWVVYFVHDTARRIMVDNEIARTQKSLRRAIDRLLEEEPREKDGDADAIPDGTPTRVPAADSGYVTAIYAENLASLAKKYDLFIRVVTPPGTFVVSGGPIAAVYGDTDDGIAGRIREAIVIGDARAPEGDIRFNIHLMVEIALRALSSGLNDAYTAISAIDHLSASLALILQRGAPSSLYHDAEGEPRVWLDLIEVKDIVGTALHPLRRAAQDNTLVSLRLIKAIGRMSGVTRMEHAHVLRLHLRLIAYDAKHVVKNPDDRNELAGEITRARRILAGRRQDD
ncbi:MAG: DUF2254 domain-containing protein [Alphaproteobacteria bacterium]